MGELLEKAQKFIERVKDNRVYEQKIFNFGHSQDLTFRHLGVAYLVDENFSRVTKRLYLYFKDLKYLLKSIQDHHFEDVFFPFIKTSGEKKGNFSRKLNKEFISSSLRKLFTMEYCLNKNYWLTIFL